MNEKRGISRQFFKNNKEQDLQDKNIIAVNARVSVTMPSTSSSFELVVTMPTTMFAKRLTSLILTLLLPFLSFKKGRVEAVGEFFFPC